MQISFMERQIAEQRKKMGGAHTSTAKYIAVHKHKAVLENRLDKVRVTIFRIHLICFDCRRVCVCDPNEYVSTHQW